MIGKVLVLGAGVAGMSATLDLANAGCEVYLIEKEKEIGGKAYQYSCKRTETCQKCSACLAYQIRNQVEHHPNVRLLPFSMLTGVSGKPGDFKASVRLLNDTRLDLGAETTLEVQALLIATGFEVYRPKYQGEFGYGLYTNVMTAYELEFFLRQFLAERVPKPERIGFVQCFGSRDQASGQSYCSRVCCANTVHLALKLHFLFPDAHIRVFYQDRQSFGKVRFWNHMQEVANIEYVRGLPAKVLGYPKGKVTVCYPNTFQGTVHEDEFDWLVLATGMLPPEDRLEEIVGLQLERNRDGFYAQTEMGTNQAGVFVAGACQGPKDIPQSIAHAKAASGLMLRFLQRLSSF